MSKDDCIFVDLWEFRVSQRARIKISRMLYPQKEKDFFANEQYLKNFESKEEYEKESAKRIKIKKDEEKFYINSLITGFQGQDFRTKGLSIFRHQLPHLIEALENIHEGNFDEKIEEMLQEGGILKNNHNKQRNKQVENAQPVEMDEEIEEKTEDEKFEEWKKTLNKRQQTEINGLLKSGWTKAEAKIAFEAKHMEA
tara:strand:+ start:146 stop:736 length:591 start_codon:yes stop_codon:yes gene_type:complete